MVLEKCQLKPSNMENLVIILMVQIRPVLRSSLQLPSLNCRIGAQGITQETQASCRMFAVPGGCREISGSPLAG